MLLTMNFADKTSSLLCACLEKMLQMEQHFINMGYFHCTFLGIEFVEQFSELHYGQEKLWQHIIIRKVTETF